MYEDRERRHHVVGEKPNSIGHRRSALCGALLFLASGFVAASSAAAVACPSPFTDAGGGWCSADFVYTGAPQLVTLPAGGWYAVRIDALGAQGGDSREDGIGQSSVGGSGGRQRGTVVRPGGTTFTLIVGQLGSMQQGGAPILGGYGGGGQPPSVYGGGGGGGSFVFDDAGPIVIAGGGGGGGWDANPTWSGGIFSANQQAPGGAGAGAVGPAGDGQSVAFCCDTNTPPVPHYAPGGGQGATAAAPGAGGVPGTPPNYIFGQTPGDAGQGPATGPLSLGIGGNGGGTTGGSGCLGTWSGGGGGGYNGGGGGGDIPCDLEGGGGGGGVGYVDPFASDTQSQSGVQLGDGMITLAYSTTTQAQPVVTTNPVDQNVNVGQPFSFSAAASGSPAPSAKWQVSIDGGATFNDVPGATATTYGGTAALSDSGNLYRAVFINAVGSATTTAATLAVTPTPMACGMGAGLPNGTKPPRNVGTVKISAGATSNPATKSKTLKLSGTLENCTGFDGVVSKYPISSGSFVASVKLPPGATCSDLVAGVPLKSRLVVKWKGINPKTGKPATAAATDVSTLVTFSQVAGPLGFDATSAPLAGKRSAFVGKTIELSAVIDQSASDIAAACAARGGLKILNFTGVNGPSSLTLR